MAAVVADAFASSSAKGWVVRASGVLKFDECPRAYYYQYVLGIRTEAISANLPFGEAVHEACTTYLKQMTVGQSFDPVREFEARFSKALDTMIVDFNTTMGPEDLLATGKRLCEQWPEAWESTGLQVLVDVNGEPVVERRLKSRIAPGIVLSGQPDVVAMDVEGDIVVPDLKTPASPSPEWFAQEAEQLTGYQILLEDPKNAITLGTDRVDRLGFLEGIKRKMPSTSRGQGPMFVPPQTSERRSEEAVEEYKMKIMWMRDDIRRGRFPKRSKMAYNTPCALCDFRGLCYDNDWEGLIKPTSVEAQQPKESVL